MQFQSWSSDCFAFLLTTVADDEAATELQFVNCNLREEKAAAKWPQWVQEDRWAEEKKPTFGDWRQIPLEEVEQKTYQRRPNSVNLGIHFRISSKQDIWPRINGAREERQRDGSSLLPLGIHCQFCWNFLMLLSRMLNGALVQNLFSKKDLITLAYSVANS